MVYSEEKYVVLGRLEQPRQDKNILYRHEEQNAPTKERHIAQANLLLIVLVTNRKIGKNVYMLDSCSFLLLVEG